jgi:hypothetical protein
MKKKSPQRAPKPAARARRPQAKQAKQSKIGGESKIGGVPVTGVSFFGSLKGGKTITTYCPFCDKTVKACQKGYLMACKKCGRRID